MKLIRSLPIELETVDITSVSSRMNGEGSRNRARLKRPNGLTVYRTEGWNELAARRSDLCDQPIFRDKA